MSLSNDIISQFVKITNDSNKTPKKESIMYGRVVIKDKKEYVVLDGTRTNPDGTKAMVPCSKTVDVKDGDRVIVMIKNCSAVITGNLGNPSTTTAYVDDKTGKVIQTAQNAETKASEALNKVTEFGNLKADRADVEELTADIAAIENLETDSLLAQTVKANKLGVNELTVKNAEIEGELDAAKVNIDTLNTKQANFENATAENFEATNAEVGSLKTKQANFEQATAENFEATAADIQELDTKKLDAESAKLLYANIDFSNITKATMEYFYSQSGLIENAVIGDGSITGVLIGVTIKGDLIEGGTVVADKLVIRGEDGLYYKLNTDGVTTEAEQTEYNSLNGSVITAKSITAEKVSVNDLVAFGATIGGYHITTNSLYSGVKESVDNATRGVYLDESGQISLGDADNFLRYYQDDNGNWKLEISAESILFGGDSKSSASDIKSLTEHVKISTYTDPETSEVQPCVELSEGDSEFKQVITNTATMFKDGDMVRTKIDTEGVETENIRVKEEFRQGGFVWKTRANGNMGLTWKGGNS